jgi:hypothetical protein
MKTIIRSIALALLCLYFHQAYAQPCSVSNTKISIRSVNPSTCQVTFDLTFTADFNPGNKHAVVHLWEDVETGGYDAANTYPAKSGTSLTSVNLAEITLVIRDPGTNNPQYEQDYPVSLGSINSPYMVPEKFIWNGPNSARTYTFTGLVVTLPNCTSTVNMTGDVYATQNDQNTTGGCISRRSINFTINDPVMAGSMNCSKPRSLMVSFSTLKETEITFEAYKDVAPYNLFDENDKQAANLLALTDATETSTSKTVSNPELPVGEFVTYGPYTYSQQTAGSQFGVWIVARAGDLSYENILLINNTCSALPVAYQAFTAARSKQQVTLKWTTSMEDGNAGFTIERKFGTDGWKDVAFVPSKSTGASSELLNYQYLDINNSKGVSQYRLKQIDVTGQFRYSEIKAVKGDGQQLAEVLLYPNPAKGGSFTVVLNDTEGVYDMQVVDAYGRMVKQFTGVRTSKTITDLPAGQYLVIALNKQNGTRVAEKMIVQ